MDDAVLLYLTIDHQIILSWAGRRGARPATCEGDEHPWPLFFNIGSGGPLLREISWDEFFAEFDRAQLIFVYRDTTPSGELDDWHEFVKRAAVPELAIAGISTIVQDW
jgi:hypothetical protein